MKKIIWTPTRAKSLQNCYEFLLLVCNEETAESFLSRLDERIAQIQLNPKLAPRVKHSVFRRLIVHETISLFYRNYPEHIKLLLIWDNRQDAQKLAVLYQYYYWHMF